MATAKRKKNRRFERRRVLDVKLRSSQRRQTWVRRLAFLLVVVLVLGGGGYSGWRGLQRLWLELVERNPYFTMERLDIRTEGVIAPAQIQRWAGVEPGHNLFGVYLERVKRDLELVPAIRSASVERVLPDTLRIRIVERRAVARLVYPVVHQPGKYRVILVDAEGFAMLPLGAREVRENSSRHYEQLPLFTGVPADRVRPGWPIVSDRVDAALELIGAFEASPMAGLVRVRAVDVSAPGMLRLSTQTGCEVLFGLTDYDRQLRRWWEVVQHAQRAGLELGWLDLSVSNNVPARWRERPPSARSAGRAGVLPGIGGGSGPWGRPKSGTDNYRGKEHV